MSDFIYSFEKLRVWNDARALHKDIYETTRQLIALRDSQLRA
jgi:hypothetical protein